MEGAAISLDLEHQNQFVIMYVQLALQPYISCKDLYVGELKGLH
jgi:hypothetical protein